MHIELTRQSVVIKCNLEASIMTGNYEFYFAAGLLGKLTAKEIPQDIQPVQLYDLVQEMLQGFEGADGQEKHLVHMLKYYHPEEDYNEEMVRLLNMGLNEQKMWQRFI